MLTHVFDTAVQPAAEACGATGARAGTGAYAVVREPAAIERLWRDFETRAAGHVFQSYDFVELWCRHVGSARGVVPFIVVGRDERGRARCILPFGVRRCLGRSSAEWLGGEHSDYNCGLYDPAFLDELAASPGAAAAFRADVLRLLRSSADLAHLRRQPRLLAGRPNPLLGPLAIPYTDHAHDTVLGGDWESYYRTKRNSHSRRTDRSKLRRLEELGAVRIFDATTPDEIDRVMAALFHQKQRMLGQRGLRNIFATGATRDFYAALGHKTWPDGPAHVAAMEVDGAIVATNWGLVRDGRYYYVMHSYDDREPVARSSPGRLLMYHLMQWCIARGIARFDFTIGDDTFKSLWCENADNLYDDVVALRPTGADLASGLRVGKPVKRFIKSDHRLRRLAIGVRSLFLPAVADD